MILTTSQYTVPNMSQVHNNSHLVVGVEFIVEIKLNIRWENNTDFICIKIMDGWMDGWKKYRIYLHENKCTVYVIDKFWSLLLWTCNENLTFNNVKMDLITHCLYHFSSERLSQTP